MPDMATVPVKKSRFNGIDELRGIIMVIMALDHVRDFIYHLRFLPTDLSQASAFLFLTRWITNLCAPVFVFLAGTGAYLHLSHKKSKRELTAYLLSRGFFIVLLDIFVMRFIYCFNFNYYIPNTNLLQVLWAIGWSMIALGFLIYLPDFLLGLISVAMLAGHNLFDGVVPSTFGSLSWLWILLHSPGEITVFPGIVYKIIYPLIPWIGVMGLGFLLGKMAEWEEDKKHRTILWIGISSLAAFVFIRWLNIYGDPSQWVVQNNSLFTFFSFINCTKYPPSLLYLLMTLGMAFIILYFIRRRSGPVLDFFLVFGRVPMFYYLLHFFMAHLFAIGLALVRYRTWPVWLFQGNPFYAIPPYPAGPADWGWGLITVYIVWITIVAILYPLCKWYMKYKKEHNYVWLSYL